MGIQSSLLGAAGAIANTVATGAALKQQKEIQKRSLEWHEKNQQIRDEKWTMYKQDRQNAEANLLATANNEFDETFLPNEAELDEAFERGLAEKEAGIHDFPYNYDERDQYYKDLREDALEKTGANAIIAEHIKLGEAPSIAEAHGLNAAVKNFRKSTDMAIAAKMNQAKLQKVQMEAAKKKAEAEKIELKNKTTKEKYEKTLAAKEAEIKAIQKKYAGNEAKQSAEIERINKEIESLKKENETLKAGLQDTNDKVDNIKFDPVIPSEEPEEAVIAPASLAEEHKAAQVLGGESAAPAQKVQDFKMAIDEHKEAFMEVAKQMSGEATTANAVEPEPELTPEEEAEEEAIIKEGAVTNKNPYGLDYDEDNLTFEGIKLNMPISSRDQNILKNGRLTNYGKEILLDKYLDKENKFSTRREKILKDERAKWPYQPEKLYNINYKDLQAAWPHIGRNFARRTLLSDNPKLANKINDKINVELADKLIAAKKAILARYGIDPTTDEGKAKGNAMLQDAKMSKKLNKELLEEMTVMFSDVLNDPEIAAAIENNIDKKKIPNLFYYLAEAYSDTLTSYKELRRAEYVKTHPEVDQAGQNMEKSREAYNKYSKNMIESTINEAFAGHDIEGFKQYYGKKYSDKFEALKYVYTKNILESHSKHISPTKAQFGKSMSDEDWKVFKNFADEHYKDKDFKTYMDYLAVTGMHITDINGLANISKDKRDILGDDKIESLIKTLKDSSELQNAEAAKAEYERQKHLIYDNSNGLRTAEEKEIKTKMELASELNVYLNIKIKDKINAEKNATKKAKKSKKLNAKLEEETE